MKVHRRAQILCLIALLVSSPNIGEAVGRTYVRGYVRRDGTYVPPHYRTTPDGNFYNNWSTLGNVNPYTGKLGTKTTPEYGSGLRLANAQHDWARDYSMQAYSYDNNVEGYLKLSALLSSDEWKSLPESHSDWMMRMAYQDWSNDFSMQAYTLEKQLDGYHGLAKLEGDLAKLPNGIAEDILRRARSDWPNDLGMQAYVVQKEIEGYLEVTKARK